METRRARAPFEPIRVGCGKRILLAAGVLLWASTCLAAAPLQPVSPFDMTGFLQEATLDNAADVFSGGTLQVNGHTVTVPRGTVVFLPANSLTWQQLFDQAPAPYGLHTPTGPQTGLALADLPAPLTTYEVHVIGNRVVDMVAGTDRYIAGLVDISQQALNSGQGFINFIDYANGEMRIGGTLGDPNAGMRVRINDPVVAAIGTGRHSLGLSPDPRFTNDQENPTIRTETAYPLCLPRVSSDPAVPGGPDDPLCPQRNRPRDAAGTFQTIFTMPPPPALAGQPDSLQQAPFEVGDYVTFAGTLVRDDGLAPPTVGPYPPPPPAGVKPPTYISAHTMIANLGIFTARGSNPAYVAIDVTILGVGGAAIPGFPQEAAKRTRFEGFSTDPSRIVELYGIDVGCDMTPSDRNWGSALPDPGPPTGVVLGRWRFRPPTGVLNMPPSGVFLPPTREVRAVIHGAWTPGSTAPKVANGLTAGQYHAPISEYLFPENLGIGNPPVPLNFQDFPFLANGTNSLAPFAVGQLDPWPGGPVPTSACAPLPAAPLPPTANAGANQSVPSGATVTLDGTGSSDPNGLTLSFAWAQANSPPDPAVTLSGANTAFATFTAPVLPREAQPVTLTFSLTVTSTPAAPFAPLSATVPVRVTVNPAPAGSRPPTASAGADLTVTSGMPVQLAGAAADDNTPALPLTVLWTQPAGATVALSNPAALNPTFTAPVVPAGSAPVVLTFALTATNAAALSSPPSSVTVTVNPVLAPIADAGVGQTTRSGNLVGLTGNASVDPNGLPLTYSWLQVSGPPVTLSSATTANPTFQAPTVTTGSVTLRFTVTVSNGSLTSPPTPVTVTVAPPPDDVKITLVEYRVGQQRVTVNASSSVGNGTPILTLRGAGPSAVTMTSLGGGLYTALVVGVPQPATVTVTSDLGGSDTSDVTLVRP
jgi:hypothetical protein